jgi:lysozyme family protein
VNTFAAYKGCAITGDPGILEAIVEKATLNIASYQAVSQRVKVPWAVIACIHWRESSQSFTRHLHNGDPLTERTVHVPAGRPATGEPPFTWVDSAIDALCTFGHPAAWDIPGALDFMERYNGLGYRRVGVATPYLWDFTDVYTSGLFVADGKFDPDRKESRAGCVAILRTLELKGVGLGLPPAS